MPSTQDDIVSNKKQNQKIWFISIVSLLLIATLWYWNYCTLISKTESDRGTFGDMFGAVNSIFSGLAFAGIIISLYMQRIDLKNQQKELKLNRKELKLTRDEMRNSIEESKIQNETLQIQKFENTFFNMLSLHHQIVNNMDFNIQTLNFPLRLAFPNYPSPSNNIIQNNLITNNSTSSSRDFFKDSLFLLNHYVSNDLSSLIPERNYTYIKRSNIFEIITDFNTIYKVCYDVLNTDLGHYFRNLYRMLKIIDEKVFSKDEIENFKIQYSYTSIIRAQLSDAEIGWLFYNCIYENGKEKFKPLIEKYSIFSNINDETITSSYYYLYNLSAFKKTEDIKSHLLSFN